MTAGRPARFSLKEAAQNVAMFQNRLECNYHCEYCCAGSPMRPQDPPPPFTNGEFLTVFENTKRKWWFVISGGETFLYPDFVDLLSCLTRAGHWISVDTNLSLGISGVLDAVVPERVVMFSCAYHPEAEKIAENKKRFMKSVCDLADHGFRVTIPYVMHPRRFEDYEAAKKEFADLGFRITPQPCRTQHKGKTYPQDYTDEQRRVIYGDQMRPHLFELPSYLGKICKAGYSLIRIMPDGKVYRCPGSQGSLGDISKGELRLFPEPIACDREVCNCNRFVRQVDTLPELPSMMESFEKDIMINESRIMKRHD